MLRRFKLMADRITSNEASFSRAPADPSAIPSERWMRIISVAFIMYTIAYIDRTNVSLALPSMSRDLHMDPTHAGDAVGVFFWGYMVLQIPGGYLAQHSSAKKFVSLLLVFWGICSAATGLVRTGREFWWMRLALGVAEGGVWPAVLVLLSHWFPRAERARANAYWMLCMPVALILSSPLSGWILSRWSWRVLLVSEGIFPLAWLAIWWVMIHDHPRQAPWISPAERDYLETTLRRENAELETAQSEPYLKVLLRPQVLLMICIYFCANFGNYGFLFWLPSAIQKAGLHSEIETALLNAVPYVVTMGGMIFFSRHSDRAQERRRHVAAALGWGGFFMLVTALTHGLAPWISFACICLVGAGSYGHHGPFWTIPSETLPRRIAGTSMGLINAFGNLGGYFGPLAVGFVRQRSGGFVYPFAALSGAYLLGSLLALALKRAPERTAAV